MLDFFFLVSLKVLQSRLKIVKDERERETDRKREREKDLWLFLEGVRRNKETRSKKRE